MIDIIIIQALFGLSMIAQKQLISYGAPFFLVGIRLFLGGGVQLIYHYMREKKLFYRHQSSEIVSLVQLIFFGVYAKYMLRTWSLHFMSTAHIALFLHGTPLVAALMTFVVLGKKSSCGQFCGMLMGFLGMCMLGKASYLAKIDSFLVFPELSLLCAILSHCYGLILMRQLFVLQKLPSYYINGVRMIGGGFLCLVTGWFFKEDITLTYKMSTVAGVIMVTFLSNGICHNWYCHLMKKYSITFLVFADFLSTVFIVLFNLFFFNEVISLSIFVAGLFVAVGLYMFYYYEQAA